MIAARIWRLDASTIPLVHAWIEHGQVDVVLGWLSVCPLDPPTRAGLALLALRRHRPDGLLDELGRWAAGATPADLEWTLALWQAASPVSRARELRRFLVAAGPVAPAVSRAARVVLSEAGALSWSSDPRPGWFPPLGGCLEAA